MRPPRAAGIPLRPQHVTETNLARLVRPQHVPPAVSVEPSPVAPVLHRAHRHTGGKGCGSEVHAGVEVHHTPDEIAASWTATPKLPRPEWQPAGKAGCPSSDERPHPETERYRDAFTAPSLRADHRYPVSGRPLGRTLVNEAQ